MHKMIFLNYTTFIIQWASSALEENSQAKFLWMKNRAKISKFAKEERKIFNKSYL